MTSKRNAIRSNLRNSSQAARRSPHAAAESARATHTPTRHFAIATAPNCIRLQSCEQPTQGPKTALTRTSPFRLPVRAISIPASLCTSGPPSVCSVLICALLPPLPSSSLPSSSLRSFAVTTTPADHGPPRSPPHPPSSPHIPAHPRAASNTTQSPGISSPLATSRTRPSCPTR